MAKIYISGKVAGLSAEEYSANFNLAKELMQNTGFEVISPIDLPHSHQRRWIDYMIEDLQALAGCDAIFMLSNWTESPGAKIEHDCAVRMGLDIIYMGRVTENMELANG